MPEPCPPTAAPTAATRVERPEAFVQYDLRQVIQDLEPIAAFERGRYGNSLSGWISDADGSRGEEEVLRAREIEAISELLTVDDENDPRWVFAQKARDRFYAALLAAEIPSEKDPERDPQWGRAREHQRRLRELESHAATAIPAAVLRLLCMTATVNCTLHEVCERVGQSFAAPGLRERWAADVAPKPKASGKAGRPRKDRTKATPMVGRLVLGRELVLWALAVWEGKPWTPPEWVPKEYRPQPPSGTSGAGTPVTITPSEPRA